MRERQKRHCPLTRRAPRRIVRPLRLSGVLDLAITLYGIKNCDTMAKARGWLDAHDVKYAFHDYKTDSIDRERLKKWVDSVGWETLLNRGGTTFRKLPDAQKSGLNESKAIALMLTQPSMIKRPVLDLGKRLLVGFKPDTYAGALKRPEKAAAKS
jgi:arsenate reductase